MSEGCRRPTEKKSLSFRLSYWHTFFLFILSLNSSDKRISGTHKHPRILQDCVHFCFHMLQVGYVVLVLDFFVCICPVCVFSVLNYMQCT